MLVLLPILIFILFIILIASNSDNSSSSNKTNTEPRKTFEQELQERNKLLIKKYAKEAQKKIDARPRFIKEFGLYLSTFDVWTKIPRVELEEKFKSYDQDLPDIFELNDFLHTIDCEAAYAYDYYMIVPVGTINFEEKRKLKI